MNDKTPNQRIVSDLEPNFIPVVVIDSAAGAAYVNFSESPVSRTVNLRDGEVMANLDLDAGQKVVGLEVVGVHELTLRHLIEVAGLEDCFTQDVIDRAGYVRSDAYPKIEPVSATVPTSDSTAEPDP